MNYKESVLILDEIKKVHNILLNCHRGPDPDGIGSNLALKAVLESLGKKVEIICPSKVISKQTNFLQDYESIKLGVDFNNFPYHNYDLLISLDTPNLSLMTGKEDSVAPKIPTIVIDHHYISTIKGFIEIRNAEATSVGEMLYQIFLDWGVQVDKNTAQCLLTSIIGDTGAFSYPNSTSQTFRIVADLMDKGVNKDKIVDRIYRNEDFQMLKFWSEVLNKMKIDKKHNFVYSMIPYEIYKEYQNLDDAKAKSASLFAPIVDGTDFGFVGVEEKLNYMTVSFRGRTDDFDTSAIAKELGGGGHKVASAVKIEGLSFDEATQKVLDAARKYARKDSHPH